MSGLRRWLAWLVPVIGLVMGAVGVAGMRPSQSAPLYPEPGG